MLRGHAEVREQQRLLADQPDAATLGRRGGDVAPAGHDAARRDGPQAGQRLEQHALAGAARSDHREVLAVGHRQIERPQREGAGRTRSPSAPITADSVDRAVPVRR